MLKRLSHILGLAVILFLTVFFLLGTAKAEDGTITRLDQWSATNTPDVAITQRILNKPIKITGLTPDQCLKLNSGNILSSVACATGSGFSTSTTRSVFSATSPIDYDSGTGIFSFLTSPSFTWTGQHTFNTLAPIFSTMTGGSVLFAGSGGVLSQDNSNFYWDDSSNFLKLNSPDTTYSANAPTGATFNISYGTGSYTANGYEMNYYIYAYYDTPSGRVFSSSYSETGAQSDDSSSSNYQNDLSWSPASGTVSGYYILKSSPECGYAFDYYIDVGNTTSYTDDNCGSWTPGPDTSVTSYTANSPAFKTLLGYLGIGESYNAATTDFRVFSLGDTSTPLYFDWDFTSQYLKFTDGAGNRRTLFADINASTVTASAFTGGSYTGTWSGNTILTNRGGTGLSSWTQGDIPYYTSGTALSKLAKNTTATRYLSNTGTNNAPAWAQINLANGVTGDLPFANLTQGSALSVLGVTGNATADVASIAAGSDHQVLRRSGTSLTFGAVNLAQSAAVTGILPVANGGTGASTAPYVTNTTDATLTRSGSGPYTLGLNLSNANTWTGKQTFGMADITNTGTISANLANISSAFNIGANSLLDINYSGADTGRAATFTDSSFNDGTFKVAKTTGAFASNLNVAGMYIDAQFQHSDAGAATTIGNGGRIIALNNTAGSGILYGLNVSATANSATAVGLNVTAASSGGTYETARFNYDGSNRMSLAVGSTGAATFDAVGSGAVFNFTDPVTIKGSVTTATPEELLTFTDSAGTRLGGIGNGGTTPQTLAIFADTATSTAAPVYLADNRLLVNGTIEGYNQVLKLQPSFAFDPGMTITAINANHTPLAVIGTASQARPTLIARAGSSQSANIQEWQTSVGGTLAYVTTTGDINSTAYNLIPVGSTDARIALRADLAAIIQASGYQYKWSNHATNIFAGSFDTGLERVSAGIVGVTDGSTGVGSLVADDIEAATYHVGSDAGIDATVTYVDTVLGAQTLTFKKGILTDQN